ncbi:hypothetical protein F5878DRAFT_31611 [Lentinula raphanica]|uniref:Uncharacterized protein n=1 Tax=Lentinula raphanica TaxID=153919 RepID=A0AA38PDV7_9AGAR|nr:hypothetical protein F5878DRAFT_31611 [Lentinula raphanica]
MIRFAFRVILFLGVISSGVLAAPTSMPRSIVEVQALQSSDHAIAGPPMVSMLETRVDEPKVHNIEDLITTLTGFLPNQEPQKESLKNRIDNLRKLDRENGDDVPQTAAAIMHDALSDNHFACLDSNTFSSLKQITVTWIDLSESMLVWASKSDRNYAEIVSVHLNRRASEFENKLFQKLWRPVVTKSQAPSQIHGMVDELSKELDAMQSDYRSIYSRAN